jgi:hypothetical protein
MVFEIDFLIPELIISLNILLLTFLPIIFSKQQKIYLYNSNQSESLQAYSILCCIIAFLIAYNNTYTSALFGFHLYNNILYIFLTCYFILEL